MGVKIKSQFPGQCKECNTKIAKGDTIFYQKDPKVVCKNPDCDAVKELFVDETPTEQDISGKKSWVDYRNLPELKLTMIDQKEEMIDDIERDVLNHIEKADHLSRLLYPKLEAVDAQTFGQIRSKIVDWRIALENGK